MTMTSGTASSRKEHYLLRSSIEEAKAEIAQALRERGEVPAALRTRLVEELSHYMSDADTWTTRNKTRESALLGTGTTTAARAAVGGVIPWMAALLTSAAVGMTGGAAVAAGLAAASIGAAIGIATRHAPDQRFARVKAADAAFMKTERAKARALVATLERDARPAQPYR